MGMSLKSYLSGLNSLREEMKEDEEAVHTLDVIEYRLNDIYDDLKKYGDTEDNRKDRTEIFGTLNEYTRNLHNISFYQYCRINKNRKHIIVNDKQRVIVATENSVGERSEQILVSDSVLDIVQQAINFASEYIDILQNHVQKAREVFNKDTNVDREHCEDALAAFYLFDCSNFPEYNQSLYRVKTRLRYVIEQVNTLVDLQEICANVDGHPSLNIKKMQKLRGILDSLYYETSSIQTLLRSVDIEMSP